MPATAAAMVYLASDDGASRALSALALLIASVFALKTATRKLRPDGADTWSFPSGHAATAGFLAAVLWRRDVMPAVLKWVPPAWALLVAAARVQRRRHDVFDVAAGLALGVAFGATVRPSR